jgi:hypothetical protein
MRPWLKLALSAVMFWLSFTGGRASEAIALCSQDTYCQYYTDPSLSSLCGERNSCINCSSVSEQWGCVGNGDRWCQTFGSCGATPRCTKCWTSGPPDFVFFGCAETTNCPT